MVLNVRIASIEAGTWLIGLTKLHIPNFRSMRALQSPKGLEDGSQMPKQIGKVSRGTIRMVLLERCLGRWHGRFPETFALRMCQI